MCAFTIGSKQNGTTELNVMQVGLSAQPSVTALKVICSVSSRNSIKYLKKQLVLKPKVMKSYKVFFTRLIVASKSSHRTTIGTNASI